MYQTPDFVKIDLNVDVSFASHYDSCYIGSNTIYVKIGGSDCHEEELPVGKNFLESWGYQCWFGKDAP